MKPLSKSDVRRTIVAMTLFALVTGCGGPITQTINKVGGTIAEHLRSGSAGSHIYKPEAGVKGMAFFFAAAPSALQQSWQGKCAFSSPTTAVPAGNFMPLVLDRGNDQSCTGSFSQPNPTLGSLVVEDGTVGTLVVTADSDTKQNLVCKDLTNTGPTTDGSSVSVWFQPSTNAVVIFSNTAQLPTTCVLPVPAGDNVLRISAQFLKS